MSNKTRIIYIIDKLTRAGTQNHLLQVLRGLDLTQYDIEVICLERRGPLVEDVRALGIQVHTLDATNWISAKGLVGVWKLYRLIRRFKPDLVHCYLFTANFFGSLVAKLAGVKKIITSRRDLGDMQSPRQIAMMNLSNRVANVVVSNSNAVKEANDQLEKIRCRHVVIHNGINLEAFGRIESVGELRRQFGLPEDKIIIGTLCNIREEKDPKCMIKAFLELSNEFDDAVLAYAGRVRDEKLYQETCDLVDERMKSKVYFLGSVADPIGFLKAIDVFAFASKSEGFSNAILEAMATGLPIVASRVGGNIEQVVDGRNGYLYESGDFKACADGLKQVLQEGSRETFGSVSQQIVRDDFNVAGMVKKMEALYASID